MLRQIWFKDRCFSFEMPQEGTYIHWRRSVKELSQEFEMEYRYTHSFLLEPQALFHEGLMDFLRCVVRDEAFLNSVDKFNRGLTKRVHKLYTFMQQYNPLFEDLYSDFEDYLTEELNKKKEATTVDIFGTTESKAYLLRFTNTEKYRDLLVKWILEKCGETYWA